MNVTNLSTLICAESPMIKNDFAFWFTYAFIMDDQRSSALMVFL